MAALRAEIDLLKKSDVVTGINLRGSSPASFAALADAFGDEVVYEIDAHSRQAPMVAAGAGEFYLKNPGALVAVVKALREKEVTVSVKMRVGVAADDRALVRALWESRGRYPAYRSHGYGCGKTPADPEQLSSFDHRKQFHHYF